MMIRFRYDEKQVYRLMGYDSEKREIKMGMLAEKTHPYIRDKVIMAILDQDYTNIEEEKWTRKKTPLHFKRTNWCIGRTESKVLSGCGNAGGTGLLTMGSS